MRKRLGVAVVMATCAWSTASSQQTPVPAFKSGLELLTVEAFVRDAAGRPVTGLQPSDFTVSIDGQPRRVLNARMFGTDDGRVATAGTPAPRFVRASDASPGRVVVFAVDRDSIRSGSEQATLETASAMISSFSPADAVGVIGLPAGGIDPTRDHAAAAAALRMMTGTRPVVNWRFRLTWREAIELASGNKEEILLVHERECSAFNSVFSPSSRDCSLELAYQARDMVRMGREHAQTVLTRLGDLLDNLTTERAPKHVVLFSGGIAFDVDLLSRYRNLSTKAAQARVAVFVVHLDQPAYDASDRMVETVFSGREFTTGLGNIASLTGGVFFEAVGTAAGAVNRIASEINAFYQLGIEAQPKDADVRTLRVKVEAARPNLTIRAPAQIAVAPVRQSPSAEAVTSALARPLDVAEVPFEVATYVTHADEAGKVRVIVSATVPDAAGFVPAEWGYQVIDGGKILGGSRDQIASPSTERWLGTASVVVPVGKYRIRTAVVASDGRVARLDLPLDAGLRAAGGVQASDLIVGLPVDGRVAPRARLTQGDPGVALLELSSAEPLTGTTGVVELTRAGTAQPAVRGILELRAQARNDAVVAGQARLDLSGLVPGTYMASAVLDRRGTPFARISRLVEVVPGVPSPVPSSVESMPAPPSPKPGAIRDLALEDVLARAGRYVTSYGEQASLIVGVERYEQRYQNAPAGERAQRKLVAELALFKTNDATGWVGFRDVVAVDGKPIPDRQDRLVALLRKIRRTSPRRAVLPTRARASTSVPRGGTSTSRQSRCSFSCRSISRDSPSPARG